ncbi:MAG TPA: carboxypeptidase regulatory-like domain-containing protein, partial [Prolixibacteraceae bacterium]|nr:carboxypeptidase regulatory-like domain-containing protein [Prolixibacteraceae bacterium]
MSKSRHKGKRIHPDNQIMKLTIFYTLLLFGTTLACFSQEQEETITISGKVTDFNGASIDSAFIQLKHSNFSEAYHTFSDAQGNYHLTVKKGRYLAMYVIRIKEYPRSNAVPDEDQRLEFWAWNIIADKDLVINPRYDRLELYGVNIFQIERAYMIYVRPMSLGKLQTYGKEISTDKAKTEKIADISVKPENFKVQVFANERP